MYYINKSKEASLKYEFGKNRTEEKTEAAYNGGGSGGGGGGGGNGGGSNGGGTGSGSGGSGQIGGGQK